MIEEIVGMFVSVISLFTSEAPQLFGQNSELRTTATTEEIENETIWRNEIHREYEREDRIGVLPQVTGYFNSSGYVSLDSQLSNRPSWCQSILRSFRVSVSIMLAMLPLGVLAIAVLSLDLNTTDLCFEWQHHNSSISRTVLRWRLIGEDIQAILLNLWFPMALIVLFGWKEFKSNYLCTLYAGFAIGAVVVIFKTFLFAYDVYDTKIYYRYPGNVLFGVGVVWSSVLVTRKIHKVNPRVAYSKLKTFAVISIEFLTGTAIAMVYRYIAVPGFIEQQNEINKAIFAAITPIVSLIPTAVCTHIALHQSSAIVQPTRSFVFVYFLRGVPITLYRIMQAEFKNIWLYVGLSLLSGCVSVTRIATRSLREKLWACLIQRVKRYCCCKRLRQVKHNTPHYRRFHADMVIQEMLFENTAFILGQAYIVLYLIASFNVPVWPVLKESLFRITIGLGIDFVFNSVSIFVQIHWFDIPAQRVWLKHWKRHMLANIFITTGAVSYFSTTLLSIYQARMDKHPQRYTLRNCTFPFDSL